MRNAVIATFYWPLKVAYFTLYWPARVIYILLALLVEFRKRDSVPVAAPEGLWLPRTPNVGDVCAGCGAYVR